MSRSYEGSFESKAKEILLNALDKSEFETEELEDIEEFTNAIWNNKALLRRIGEEFFDALNNWNGDETFEEVRSELEE